MPHRHPETPDRECICLTPPLPPAPVEYRWGIQTYSAAPRAINPQWICSPCLATRTIGQPFVTVVGVIHTDPADPNPTCADCETRHAPSDKIDAINKANAPHRPPPVKHNQEAAK